MAMSGNSLSYFLLVFSVLTVTFPEPTSSLSSLPLDANSKFDDNFILSGDAVLVGSGASVRLTRSMPSSLGLLLLNKPFKFLESNSNRNSFYTDFTFSISPHNGDGLALIIVPADFSSKFSRNSSYGLSSENRFLGIEFDTSVNSDVGDENANHVGVDVCNLASTKVSNVSSINLVLNSGVKLRSWVHYDSSLRILAVWLSRLGIARPLDPLLTYPIDLSEMWKGEEVFVGISSSSGNSLQTTSVHSWRFEVFSVPKWLHSQAVNQFPAHPLPLNPVPKWLHSQPANPHELETEDEKKNCHWSFGAALFLLTLCGALAAFILRFSSMISAIRDALVHTECSGTVDCRYEKINVIVENSSEVVKN